MNLLYVFECLEKKRLSLLDCCLSKENYEWRKIKKSQTLKELFKQEEKLWLHFNLKVLLIFQFPWNKRSCSDEPSEGLFEEAADHLMLAGNPSVTFSLWLLL